MLSYGALKLFPVWDPLRGDPRFEKIVASLAPKERQLMVHNCLSMSALSNRRADAVRIRVEDRVASLAPKQ